MLTVIVTVTVNTDMLCAHAIERGTGPLYNSARVRICVLTQAYFECVHVYQLDVWGQTQLKFRTGPSLTSPAITVLALADFAEFHVPV